MPSGNVADHSWITGVTGGQRGVAFLEQRRIAHKRMHVLGRIFRGAGIVKYRYSKY